MILKINILRVILIIYTSLVVPILDNKQLELVNNNIIRLIVVALIVYLSFMDMVTAILLTISFLVTLHQARNLSKTSKNINNNNNKNSQVIDVAENNNKDIQNNLENIINKKEHFAGDTYTKQALKCDVLINDQTQAKYYHEDCKKILCAGSNNYESNSVSQTGSQAVPETGSQAGSQTGSPPGSQAGSQQVSVQLNDRQMLVKDLYNNGCFREQIRVEEPLFESASQTPQEPSYYNIDLNTIFATTQDENQGIINLDMKLNEAYSIIKQVLNSQSTDVNTMNNNMVRENEMQTFKTVIFESNAQCDANIEELFYLYASNNGMTSENFKGNINNNSAYENDYLDMNNILKAPKPFDNEDNLQNIANGAPSDNDESLKLLNNNQNNLDITAPPSFNSNENTRDEDLQKMNNNHPASKTMTENILGAQGAMNNINKWTRRYDYKSKFI